MRNKNLFTGLMALVFGLFVSTTASALPSLDAQLWDSLKVEEKIGKSTEEAMITVIRDSAKPLVWYYVPNRPRLAEVVSKKDGKTQTKPVFQLMTLQTKDAKSKNIYEEGMLQFSLRMDLQPETASQAKNLIFEKLKKSGNATETSDITLLPLPVSSATISLYQPSGAWLSSGMQQPAIAPIFSTQAVPFQINLTSLGADAMKALTQKGQGGLGVAYQFSFEGVLPPSKLTIEVDWDQTFKHYSENTKTKTYGFAIVWGGTKKTNDKSIAESLLENKCIKTSMEGREDELEELQKVMDVVIERINAELMEKMTPPEKVDPAEAEEPSYGAGIFCGQGSSKATKSKDVVKKGKEKFTFERAKIVTRESICGTFIGIGNYDKEIIEAANIVMDPGNWEKAYFTVPAVGNDPSLLSISLNQYVQYKEGSGKPAGVYPSFSGAENPQLITWRPTALNGKPGWVNRDGEAVSNISWPLQALYAEARNAAKAAAKAAGADESKEVVVDINNYVEYKVEIKISSKGKGALVDEVEFSKILPMMAGDKPVTNPMALVDSLTVTCDYLTLDPKEGLKNVQFDIERKDAEGKERLARYSWKFDYKSTTSKETSHSWFIPKEGDFQYIPKVLFNLHKKNTAGKAQVAWEYNGKNLLSPEGYGALELDPGDEAWDPEDEF
ncbi:MAG TPA: hypothetical protein PLM07_18525 [Candidatus Rifleibacterium sp.]|nr:hypothetical protein [Candidatus Rifleibacterium sp.]HPT47879.1 hypothetical protein [Candidatus Rifleibacterium sp.]